MQTSTIYHFLTNHGGEEIAKMLAFAAGLGYDGGNQTNEVDYEKKTAVFGFGRNTLK